MWALLASILLVLGAYSYLLHCRWYSYWSSRGVPGPRPWPLFGNCHEILLNTFCELEVKRANTYGKCYGAYIGTAPWLTITDHRLIRQVLATDFPHFLDRMNLSTLNPFWNSNLLAVNGQHWRRIRSLTTPAFTASKLRGMHPMMGRSAEKLVSHLNSTLVSSSSTVQIKAIIACFAIDVIAKTSFSAETDAISDGDKREDSENAPGNAVVENCRQLFVIPPLRLAAIMVLPKCLLRLLSIDCFLPSKPFNFLIDLTRHIIRERKASAVAASLSALFTESIRKKRINFVRLLVHSRVDEAELERSTFEHLEAAGQEQEEEKSCEIDSEEDENEKKESQPKVDQFKTPLQKAKSKSGLTGLTETEIIAQGIFFLTAGYETSSSTISHALFELAQNQSAQARLYDELKTVLDSLPSTTSRTSVEYFEAVIGRLPYLEAVLKETLRKYAPVQAVLRTTVTDGHRLENGLRLEKGQTIMIPVGAVHHCPEYYPEPQEFRPERFLPENAHLLVPYTWLPFGAGARNCIGMRFAMEEMKICLAALLENFEFSPAPNTPKELVFQRGTPVLNATEFPLYMTKRKMTK